MRSAPLGLKQQSLCFSRGLFQASANNDIPEKWEEAGVKLWDAATRSDTVVAALLGPRRVEFEALKK